MSISTDNKSVCANCGKEGSDVTNTCNKCKSVKYCNAACKKKHRTKHKKACERRVAELHDEKLFKQPPPLEDCPICFQRLPSLETGVAYKSCCGKMICSGCIHAPVYDHEGNTVADDCPFCRTPVPVSNNEMIERYEKLMEQNDAVAIYNFGCMYAHGHVKPKNYAKALEFWQKAGELGYADAYYGIGMFYSLGKGVPIDENKERHYWELAAIGGNVDARYNLGVQEMQAGNMDRAIKHYMIAVRDGEVRCLVNIKYLYQCGHATKDDFTEAIRIYQAYLDDIMNKYYESFLDIKYN